MTEWVNKIVSHGEEDPGVIMAHPLNPRVHSSRQRKKIIEHINDVGFIQTVIINKRTGKLLI